MQSRKDRCIRCFGRLGLVLANTLLKEVSAAEGELGFAGSSAPHGAQAPTGIAANAATQA